MQRSKPIPKGVSPGTLALLYAVLASLWIVTSDQLLTYVSDDPELAQRIGMVKGLIFVAVTAGLLYLLLLGCRNHLPEPAVAHPPRPGRGGLILIFLALATVIPLLDYGIVRIHGPELQEDQYQELKAIAKLKAGQIENWVAGHRANADLLAKRGNLLDKVDEFLRTGNPEARDEVRQSLDDMANAYGYDIDLVTRDDRNVFDPANAASDPVAPELLESALRSGEVQYRDLYREKTGHIHLDFIVPLVRTDSAGARQPIGAVVLHTPVRRFLFPLVQEWPTSSPSAETVLTRREGNSVLFLNELRHRKNTALSSRFSLDSPRLPSAVSMQSGAEETAMEGIDYRGVPVLAVGRPIPGTPWHLVAKVDRDEVMAPLKKLVFWVGQVSFFAIACVSAGVFLLWRQRLRSYRFEIAAQSMQALRESEARYRSLFENMLEGYAYCRMLYEHDEPVDFVYLDVNPAFGRLTGLRNVVGRRVSEIIPALRESNPEIFRIYGRVARGGAAEKLETYIDSLGIWFSLSVFSPEKEFFVAVFDNITERKKNEEHVRLAATVFESSQEGIVVTDAEQRIQMVNRAFCELTGYSEEEILGQTPRLLRSGRQETDFYAGMWAAIREAGHWQGEIWNRRKNGELYPELLSISAVRNAAGSVTHYVGVFVDITLLKSSEAQLDFLAHHDPLTGLPNRLLLLSRLQHSLEVALRENGRVALLMLDLDRFKDVNDSFGHPSGDELLQVVADRLLSRVRRVDTVSRLGGDEFTVLLEDLAHAEDAARLADGIITSLGEPCRLSNGAELRIGVSVGISLYPDNGQTAVDLLQQADAALYRAKAEGRGCFKYFSEDLTRAARERIDLGTRLRRAIAENQLRLHYQPQVDIASGRIVGAEALVRWQDPEKGMIPPDRFIPVAEETGLIGEIGVWVLREACRQGKAWLDSGLLPLKLAVNLSPHQFRHNDINATVAQVLRETGYPAERLELELTESALMEREETVVEILDRLRERGIRLAIDDFGTGYSSLAYLRRFPLDVLKIDKSFVHDIPLQRDDMEIAAAIVAMGHTLGFKVLAEGVETAEQLAFLQSKGCDLYQGYLTSPPVQAEAFAEMMAREWRG